MHGVVKWQSGKIRDDSWKSNIISIDIGFYRPICAKMKSSESSFHMFFDLFGVSNSVTQLLPSATIVC